MINHTPGPWTVSEINAAGNVDEFCIFIEPNVAVIERKIEGQNECDMPDAHLISEAPNLLAALCRIMDNLCPFTGTPSQKTLVEFWDSEKKNGRKEADDMLFALNTIAKAKGE